MSENAFPPVVTIDPAAPGVEVLVAVKLYGAQSPAILPVDPVIPWNP